MQVLLVVAVAAAVVAVVLAPLRAPPGADDGDSAGERESLEAARQAKYREIRDAELDMRTGKLAREDWEAIDRRLRAEAMEILRALDRVGSEPGARGSS